MLAQCIGEPLRAILVLVGDRVWWWPCGGRVDERVELVGEKEKWFVGDVRRLDRYHYWSIGGNGKQNFAGTGEEILDRGCRPALWRW